MEENNNGTLLIFYKGVRIGRHHNSTKRGRDRLFGFTYVWLFSPSIFFDKCYVKRDQKQRMWKSVPQNGISCVCNLNFWMRNIYQNLTVGTIQPASRIRAFFKAGQTWYLTTVTLPDEWKIRSITDLSLPRFNVGNLYFQLGEVI